MTEKENRHAQEWRRRKNARPIATAGRTGAQLADGEGQIGVHHPGKCGIGEEYTCLGGAGAFLGHLTVVSFWVQGKGGRGEE